MLINLHNADGGINSISGGHTHDKEKPAGSAQTDGACAVSKHCQGPDLELFTATSVFTTCTPAEAYTLHRRCSYNSSTPEASFWSRSPLAESLQTVCGKHHA